MAYRKPGVTVTQQFLAAAPGLAAFALPCCAIGPAYQIVNNDAIGTYTGAEQSYAYASLAGGAIVDTAELAENEAFPVTKKPISVQLKNVVVQIVAPATTGAGTGTAFSDATSGQFDDVLAGDILVITEALGVTIVAAQTNGQSSDTAGQRNRLTAGTASQFANVKVGDTVTVTGGTNTITGTFTVTIKLNSNVLILDADVNDGVGPSTNVAFSITGDRGTTNAGEHKIKQKTSANALVLQSPLPDSPEAPLSYSIKRALATPVDVARVSTVSSGGFFADDAAITLPTGYQVTIGSVDFDVLEADVEASYRALRTDLASEVREYKSITEIEAVFGVGQLVPANPLAYALFIMKQNTATAVNGLALSSDFVTDEALSFTKSLDVLSLVPMYALAPLAHNGAVHTMFKNHVEQLSAPAKKLERVSIFNSKLNKVSVLQSDLTTSTSLVGSRSIVTTQVDGAGAVASPTVLNDATTDQFLNVQAGDSVTIVSGTGVTAGTYLVASKQSSNQITLASSFITSGTPTDIQYYIQRRDGLGADGVTFYDRNAAFITNGVAAGHYIQILSGSYKGLHKIATVVSDKEVVLATAILGVTSLLAAVEYKVVRDLTKSEQATNVAGYSSSFASRRAVHTWPDVVKAPVGSSILPLPGYFASATIAALTTGLPTQQGFTNLAVSGFLGLEHSTKYFSEDQLNTMADGGTLIFVQEGPEQPLVIRHQLTTDRSQIKFQEYSVTKNVDFVAKFLRDAFKSPIGRYNIVDTTLDYLKTVATASITFLRDKTKLPFIGGNIRSGSLALLAEDETQIDTVNMKFALSVPIPLNYIDIVIEV